METVTKKYVEYSLYGHYTISVDAENGDAFFYLKNGANGFRFYEGELSEDGEVVNRCDLTGWIYIGTRYSSHEFIEKFGGISKYTAIILYIQEHNIPFVCLTKSGEVLIMKDEDMTLEELLAKYKEQKTL